MTRVFTASPSDLVDPPLLSNEDREAERLQVEGWPLLRGSASQRDARFVKELLKAQLALVRGCA
jgi:hypothetical protein